MQTNSPPTIHTAPKQPAFTSLVRRFMRTMEEYREAKAAVAVTERLGQDARDVRHLAATLQVQHLEAVSALVLAARAFRLEGEAAA